MKLRRIRTDIAEGFKNVITWLWKG